MPALPNMPAAPILLVITSLLTGQRPLHESAQPLVMRRFDHKVKIIQHRRENKWCRARVVLALSHRLESIFDDSFEIVQY